MLTIFTKVPGLGGNVRFVDKNRFVIWVENDRIKILNILHNVFDLYPPLTSRLHFQLLFLRQFITTSCSPCSPSVLALYFSSRSSKFLNQATFISQANLSVAQPISYFSPWLSGFIEA